MSNLREFEMEIDGVNRHVTAKVEFIPAMPITDHGDGGPAYYEISWAFALINGDSIELTNMEDEINEALKKDDEVYA